VLVVVDGADGAGKTVLADELARLLPTSVRASLDDFHHPRAHRHALGRTGETVWERDFDYPAVRRELLDPWRRGSGAARPDDPSEDLTRSAECARISRRRGTMER
jgi:uridine kinase